MKHSKGPFIFTGHRLSGHDIVGRREWRGQLFSEERDDYGQRKIVIQGDASEEDWNLFEAAPDLLEAARRMEETYIRGADAEALDRCAADLRKAIAKAERKP